MDLSLLTCNCDTIFGVVFAECIRLVNHTTSVNNLLHFQWFSTFFFYSVNNFAYFRTAAVLTFVWLIKLIWYWIWLDILQCGPRRKNSWEPLHQMSCSLQINPTRHLTMIWMKNDKQKRITTVTNGQITIAWVNVEHVLCWHDPVCYPSVLSRVLICSSYCDNWASSWRVFC